MVGRKQDTNGIKRRRRRRRRKVITRIGVTPKGDEKGVWVKGKPGERVGGGSGKRKGGSGPPEGVKDLKGYTRKGV